MRTTAAHRGNTVAEVVLGVDTHLDFHVAVALDELGRRLGELTMPTTAKGYESLLWWAQRVGPVRSVGLEGTGSYGAGLAQHLRSHPSSPRVSASPKSLVWSGVCEVSNSLGFSTVSNFPVPLLPPVASYRIASPRERGNCAPYERRSR